mgnify:FL=1
MVICLTLICIVCSALLAGVYALTEAPIKKAAADKLNSAISEVLPEFSSLSEEKSIEFSGKTYSYYEVADSAANVLGYAVKAAVGGFGGPVSLMVGVLPDGTIYNTKVLSHSETPGLGAKCTEPAFADQFKGFDPSVKKLSVKKDGGDIDAITAATITSRAYTETVALAVAVSEAVRGVNVGVEDVIDTFDGASSAVNNGGPEK